MKTGSRGSILAAAVVASALIVGIGAALSTASLSFNRTSGVFNENVRVSYGAEAGLERARYEVATSAYDSAGNLWLMAASIADDGDGVYPSPGDVPALAGLAIGPSTVDVYAYRLDGVNAFYRLVAQARAGDRSHTLAQDIRARDTFARYMFFVDADYINFGTSTVRGDVHDNKWINYYYGGAKFYGDVTAKMGFNYYSGATPANTTFYAGANPNAGHINLPSVNEINALRPQATGVYDVHNDNPVYGGSGALNAEIQFLGNQVTITAKKQSNGAVVKSGTYPLPPNGVIFVQGDVVSVKGKCSGRATVACMGNVRVTDRIAYEDADGDPAYLLYQNGIPIPGNNTPPGVAWLDGAGYEYLPNPLYNPPAATPPVVGLMTAMEVEIVNSAPYNMEMHAAVFSATKNWYCNLGSQKGNLRVLGSLVSNKRGWRYNGSGFGYALSGEYIYDQILLQNPPPYWLAVDKPVWGPRWRVASS